MDKIAPITVGDNVYIGSGAYIMPGVTIGNNVIIGARALVTKDCECNSVYIGVPARRYSSLNEYYERCKNSVDPTPGMPYEEKKQYYLKKFDLL